MLNTIIILQKLLTLSMENVSTGTGIFEIFDQLIKHELIYYHRNRSVYVVVHLSNPLVVSYSYSGL